MNCRLLRSLGPPSLRRSGAQVRCCLGDLPSAELGTARYITAAQNVENQALIRRHTPDELGPPFALWARVAVQELI